MSYLLAVILLANPFLSVEFLIGAQKVKSVLEGRIAIIQANPADMLTYDSLQNWRAALALAPPTFAAGRSLVILNALPIGVEYNEDSFIYKQVCDLRASS